MLYLNFHNHSYRVSFKISAVEALGWQKKLRDSPKYSRNNLFDSIILDYAGKPTPCHVFYSAADGTPEIPNWSISKKPKNRIVLKRIYS